jgi:hypothetical protein
MKSKIKAKKHKLSPIWYVLGIGVILVILLFVVSSVINVGEKFRGLGSFGKYIEWGFYILVAFLLWFLLINPIRVIITAPDLSIITTVDGDSSKYDHLYKKVAKNIVKANDLESDSVKLLTDYKNVVELKLNLQIVFDKEIKKQLNDVIIAHAKTVMISTAISQNARVDMFTVYAVNLRLIKTLVERCGFRPSYKNLSKLSVRVFATALIADGLQSITMDDILPQSALGPLNEIPFIKPIMSSITQGVANGLLTIRIGVVTRKYLFKDGSAITREDIRSQAWKESLKLIPQIVADTFTFVPKKIVKFFTKGKNEKKEQELAQIEG